MKHSLLTIANPFVALAIVLIAAGCSSDGGVGNDQETDGSGTATTNSPPAIWGEPEESVIVGSQYVFAPESDDPDGDVLSFQITNPPVWAQFDAGSGILQGVPAGNHVGSYSGIVISVTDGNSVSSLPGFAISVTPADGVGDDGGTGSGDDGSGDGGAGSGDDGSDDGGTGSGDDGSDDGGTGSGDDGSDDGGAGSGDDGGDGADGGSGDDGGGDSGDGGGDGGGDDDGGSSSSPPTISGQPNGSVIVETNYAFQPEASDPDGDLLSFSIVNKPSWAEFNTLTGKLYGVPGTADVGTTSDIELSVTDGDFIDSLEIFSITVDPAGSSSVTLSWTPPSQNSDGSQLNDLSGYRIYYGTVSGQYDRQIEVNSPGVASYPIEDLADGSYFLVMTSVNSANMESTYSSELRFVVGD